MYNEKNKQNFLKQFKNKDTQETYSRIFRNSELMERDLDKDLYDFSKEELHSFIKNYLKAKTKQSVRTYSNVLSNYIQYGIDNHYSKNKFNYLKRHPDYFYSFVKDQDSLYLTKEEIDVIILSLENAQDAFIVSALFDGIQGRELHELASIKISDIDEIKKTAVVTDKVKGRKTSRLVNISSRTAQLARFANQEKEYYKRNGEPDTNMRVSTVELMTDTNYILKRTKLGNGEGQLSKYTIYNRLEMIKSLEDFVELKDALASKNIVFSGMIYRAKEVYLQTGDLTRPDIEDICKDYNMRYTWAVNDYLNIDTIKNVYNLQFTTER